MAQVHQQERQVIEHVDAGDQVAELDAVEQGRLAVEQADIVEMEVAVAAPHAALRAPSIQQRGMLHQHGDGRVAQPVDLRHRDAGWRRPPQILVVDLDDRPDALRSAMIGRDFGQRVECGDPVRELHGQFRRQRAGLRDVAEQRLLGKAPHHDHPIDRLAGPIEAQIAVGRPDDRLGGEIERRRGAAVERDLGLAGVPAQVRRRIVEIAVFDRALQLEGKIAGQEDDRGMGGDHLDALGRAPIAAGIGEKGDSVGSPGQASLVIAAFQVGGVTAVPRDALSS